MTSLKPYENLDKLNDDASKCILIRLLDKNLKKQYNKTSLKRFLSFDFLQSHLRRKMMIKESTDQEIDEQ